MQRGSRQGETRELPWGGCTIQRPSRPPADLAALLPDLSGRLLINSVFHVGAERLQQMLFSDSPFLQGFLQQCKFTGRGGPRVTGAGVRGGRWAWPASPCALVRLPHPGDLTPLPRS